MKLIVGLGNPGRRYAGTRHNVGFDVVDTIAERNGLAWESAMNVMLAKPLTFMNLSGGAIVDLLQFYKIDRSDLLVVVDDINLELARLRARPDGSAGGHNGLKSVIAQLGTGEVARLRVGVGRGTRDAISRITCWRRSTPTSVRLSPRR